MTQPIDNNKEDGNGESYDVTRDPLPATTAQPYSREAVGARIKKARHSLTLTQKEAAIKAGGMPLPSYKEYEVGKRMPGGEAIQGLMQLGINANWLLTGEGPMFLADLARPGEVLSNRVHAPIPRHTVKKQGVEHDIPSEISQIVFDKEWLSRRGIRPVDLIYIRMPDDSMTPTIRPGSFLVADGSSDKFSGDGIYAMMFNQNLSVKRLQNDFRGGLYVRSDNSSYREEHFSEDKLYLIGKVIWIGNEI